MRSLTVTTWRSSKQTGQQEPVVERERRAGSLLPIWPEPTVRVDDDLFAKAIALGRRASSEAWIPDC